MAEPIIYAPVPFMELLSDIIRWAKHTKRAIRFSARGLAAVIVPDGSVYLYHGTRDDLIPPGQAMLLDHLDPLERTFGLAQTFRVAPGDEADFDHVDRYVLMRRIDEDVGLHA